MTVARSSSLTGGPPRASPSRRTSPGAHLLHLAATGCVLNDIYREAGELGIRIDGVRVSAEGGFDAQTWVSSGIRYRVELSSPASAQELAVLLDRVDDLAEIPRAIRAGTTV